MKILVEHSAAERITRRLLIRMIIYTYIALMTSLLLYVICPLLPLSLSVAETVKTAPTCRGGIGYCETVISGNIGQLSLTSVMEIYRRQINTLWIMMMMMMMMVVMIMITSVTRKI